MRRAALVLVIVAVVVGAVAAQAQVYDDQSRPPAVPIRVVNVDQGGGFEWGDAAIGAVVGMGLAAIGFGLVVARGGR